MFANVERPELGKVFDPLFGHDLSPRKKRANADVSDAPIISRETGPTKGVRRRPSVWHGADALAR